MDDISTNFFAVIFDTGCHVKKPVFFSSPATNQPTAVGSCIKFTHPTYHNGHLHHPTLWFFFGGVSDPMGFETNVQALESADVEVGGVKLRSWLAVHGFYRFLLGGQGKKHEQT